MLKGEDIRKLSDVDLELYMLGVEEVERERNGLREQMFTTEEKRDLVLSVCKAVDSWEKSVESIIGCDTNYCKEQVKVFIALLEKVRQM